MGRKPVRTGKHFYLCTALLILSACSLVQNWSEQREIRESMLQGHHLFTRGDFQGALGKYRQVMARARSQPPADAAAYNTGLIHAHPQNPGGDHRMAMEAFNQVIARHPESPWVEQAKIWVSVLAQAEKSSREAEESRVEIERSKEAVEKSRQDAEKFKQLAEKSKQEVDRIRQEMEKSKQLLERANRIDIEIEQKRRERGK